MTLKEIRARLGKMEDADLAGLLTDTLDEIEMTAESGQLAHAAYRLAAWEDAIGSECLELSSHVHRLSSRPGFGPVKSAFAQENQLRRAAIRKFSKAVSDESLRLMARWRFAVSGYGSAIARFLTDLRAADATQVRAAQLTRSVEVSALASSPILETVLGSYLDVVQKSDSIDHIRIGHAITRGEEVLDEVNARDEVESDLRSRADDLFQQAITHGLRAQAEQVRSTARSSRSLVHGVEAVLQRNRAELECQRLVAAISQAGRTLETFTRDVVQPDPARDAAS